MGEFVRVEAAPGEAGPAIAVIRLDRPPMNALSSAVQARIAAAAAQVSAAVALRAAVQAVDEGLDAELGTGLEIERLHFAGMFATEDGQAGMRSFVENGPGKARFAGR
jgi:enoyl-CoA hydratase/carnithine racemase